MMTILSASTLRRLSSAFALYFCGLFFLSAQSFWQFTEFGPGTEYPGGRVPAFSHRLIRLDLNAANDLLAAAKKAPVRISLPLPDGSMAWFEVWETPVMPDVLQEKYPNIRCFTGKSTEGTGTLLKCDLTPQGFHAMILSDQHSPVFIDVPEAARPDMGIVYFKKDYQRQTAPRHFSCGMGADAGQHTPLSVKGNGNGTAERVLQGDCVKRRYRLALACTGEYATFHGGTKALALAAMNTSMNRVNGVYERDLSVTFQLVSKNDTLIFLNGTNDPYTNNDGAAQLDQNVTVCDARIGPANYDIGHVFSTDGGGIAGLGVVCSSLKAKGATGSESPIGDPFDIDYVVHEMGHQFGATHTQNNACARSSVSSMEPGSASTIMGYAGICAPDVQNFGEDYFHAISLQQIGQFVTLGVGNSCGAKITTGNTAPTVQAGADYTIPRSTPFALTATGNDADGDALTYCWEQMDPETGTMPPAATNAVGPMFRSRYPSGSPVRTFPRLQDLSTNAATPWERLPSVARTMKFRVTARDNRAGGGCTAEDDMVITVAGTAGPFSVTAPNTNITWGVGTTQTVTWNVASSNLAPVNCAQVRIRLSTDAGLTYPIVLAASVPNSGTASVVVPNFVSTNCRVRVEAVGNVFFDISNVNFRISAAATPTFLLSVAPIERTVCVGNSAEYSVQVDNVLTFNDTVRLSVTGVPTGATVTVQPAVVTAFPATVNVRVSNLTNAQTGTYILQMQGIAATATRTVNALLTVSPAAPANAPVLSQPADKNRDLSKVTNFAWATVPFATGYTLEISTSLLFDSNVRVVPTTASAINGLSLEFGTVYYWRVKSSNLCGDGPYSEVFSFQTEGALCAQVFNSTDVPKTIPATAATTVISNLPIAATGTIADINVSVKIDHEWTGDLTARLLAPNNSAVVLFDRPGVPADPVGCDGDDLDLVFDDEATTSYATFELSCGDAPAIQGTFQPFQPLAALRGLPLNGNWRLSVRDNESDDGGSIQTWSMSVCTSQKLPIGSLSNNRLLTVVRNTSAPIDTNLLRMVSATADNQILYTLLSLPRSGSVTRNNQTLRTGSVFTQADLAGGLIRYVHNGDTATTDQFRFQVLDGVTKAWVPDGLFRICITTPLEQSLLVPETLRCFGASNAVVTSNAAGGIPPYAYSLDGGAFQNSASFTGVAAGVHIVTVRDQKGTTAKDTVLVREPMALAVNTEVRTDSVFVVATGGSGQLAYSIDGATFSANPVFSPLPNGTYQLTVRDTNGCTVVVPFDIAVPPLSHSPFITDPIRCFGDKTGVIVAFVGGGVPPYSYSLNGGAFQSSHIFAGLGAGLYTLTVRDQRGTTSSSVNVPLSQPPAITIQPVVQLDSVFIMATGGFATLSYSLDGTTFQPDPFYARLSNGTYTVTVRDVYGCTATAGFNIAVSSLGQALAITDPIRCSGDKNGAINSYVAGGTPPYSYSLNGGAFQSSSQFTGLGSGTYTVTVRDQTGATSVSMILLADPSPVSVLAVVSSDSVAVTATGGSGALTYSIDGGVTFQSAPSFSRLWNGTYTLRVRDAYGCTASIDFTIAVPSLDQTLLVTQEIRCFGDATAVVTSYAAGGVPPYTYRLDGGNFQTNSYFEGVEAGTHTVTVSDRRGVTSTDTVLVRQPAAILVSTRVDLDSVYVIATGGSGILSYSLNGGDYQSEPYFTRLAERWHIIRVRDAYGCTVADTIVIQLPGLQVEVNKQEMWKCAGDMNNTVFAQAIGGFPPYTYSLNGGPFQSRGVFENLGTGVFTVTARDTRGGLSSGQITVQGPSPIVANIRVSRDSAIVRTSGGLGSLYHSLDSINFSMDSVFSLLPNGRYQLFVFDGAGCRKTFPFEINVAPLTATVALIAPISCFGYSDGAIEVTVAGGVPPYTYNLNGGAFGTTPRFTNIGAGTMLIGVRDARGQVIYLDTTIAQPSVLALSAMLTGDNDVALSVNGGTAPYRLFLNGAAISTGVLTDLPDGLYKIVALDSRDCADTIQVRIETIGVQNADNHWKIRAHPNPGNGHYTVELPPTATYIHLQLTDTQGRLVWTGKTGAGGGAIAIDIQAHPAGPYFLRCTDGQSAATLLILKQ